MIERKFVSQKIKEFQIQEFVAENLKRVGHSQTKIQRTPLGDKIIIYASRPGLIVGRHGQNIKALTITLKAKFNLENPQIEINEVEDVNLDAQIVAERIANSLERFGPQKFKGIGHKTMHDVMSSGALGVEILISGKIPSSRAKSWRFYQGYLKKCGDVAVSDVRKGEASALLKTGMVGIKISIMPPDIQLPDKIELIKEPVVEEAKEESTDAKTEEKPEDKKEIESETSKSEEGKEDKKEESTDAKTEEKPEDKKEKKIEDKPEKKAKKKASTKKKEDKK